MQDQIDDEVGGCLSTYYVPCVVLSALHSGEKWAENPVVTHDSQVPKCCCWNANPYTTPHPRPARCCLLGSNGCTHEDGSG